MIRSMIKHYVSIIVYDATQLLNGIALVNSNNKFVVDAIDTGQKYLLDFEKLVKRI